MKSEKTIKFTRSKVYETLDYQPEPKNYTGKVPWIVQQQVAATNGVHYVDRIGKLSEYPVFRLPVEKVKGQKLMLDIGSGWGRWLVAGSTAGYTPIGIDLRLEFCKTHKRVLADLNKKGYSVVADLENIPFIDNIFDLIWSFSVIQHTHRERLDNCLQHINRLLNTDGFTFLEFPNSLGIRNRFLKRNLEAESDYNSWSVRYYSPKEYKEIVSNHLSGFDFQNHSVLGIGVLNEDLKYVSFKNKIMCAGSLIASFFANHLPLLKNYSDSIYVKASKKPQPENLDHQRQIAEFFQKHEANPNDNLNLVSLLRCPLTSEPLHLSDQKDRLVNQREGFYYPVIDNVPIMIAEERQSN